jgi:hypothetical protein
MNEPQLPTDDEELLSDREAAEVLRQKRGTLATWRTTGRGPAFVKLGRQVLYRRSDLTTWIIQQRRDPTKAEAIR